MNSSVKPDQIILAIESAISGGSVSLIRGTTELGSRIGTAAVSRAENLIVDIKDLLDANGVSPPQVDMVAASAGPGSFTGIRIGLATAMGFAKGSGARFASTSLLAACAASASDRSGSLLIAVPTGRGAVAVQLFRGPTGELNQPEIVPEEQLDKVACSTKADRFLIHESLLNRVPVGENTIILNHSLSYLVGIYCAAHPAIAEPLFLSKN